MGDITRNRLASAVSAAQRLQLALNEQLDYVDYEAFERDNDLVFALLEEVRDVLHPVLEERAREKARAERT